MSTEVVTLASQSPSRAGVHPHSMARYPAPLGRVAFTAIFLPGVVLHFQPAYIQYAAASGVPLPQVLVPFSGVLATAGGLSVLLGYRARLGAWLLVLFLVPVTLFMHAFWKVTDPRWRRCSTPCS